MARVDVQHVVVGAGEWQSSHLRPSRGVVDDELVTLQGPPGAHSVLPDHEGSRIGGAHRIHPNVEEGHAADGLRRRPVVEPQPVVAIGDEHDAVVGGVNEHHSGVRIDAPLADVDGRARRVHQWTCGVVRRVHDGGRGGGRRRRLEVVRLTTPDREGAHHDRTDEGGRARYGGEPAPALTLPRPHHEFSHVQLGAAHRVGGAAQQFGQGLGHDAASRSPVVSSSKLPPSDSRSRFRPAATWLLTVPTELPMRSAVWASVRSW